LGGYRAIGVQRGIEGVDPREHRRHHLGGRDLLVADEAREVEGGQPAEIVSHEGHCNIVGEEASWTGPTWSGWRRRWPVPRSSPTIPSASPRSPARPRPGLATAAP